MVNKYQEITAGCVPVRGKAGKWYERRTYAAASFARMNLSLKVSTHPSSVLSRLLSVRASVVNRQQVFGQASGEQVASI